MAAIQASTDTEETLGTVVAFERRQGSSRDGGGTVRAPLVEYSVAGQTFRCKGAVSTNLPIHAVGDEVSVLYKVNDPGVAFIDSFFDRWLGPLAFVGGGLLFLSILVVVTVQKIKDQRAAPAAIRRSVPRMAS